MKHVVKEVPMGGNKTDSQIINTWIVRTAPTGQGQMYRCADGSEWERVYPPIDHATGDRIGYVVGERIIEC